MTTQILATMVASLSLNETATSSRAAPSKPIRFLPHLYPSRLHHLSCSSPVQYGPFRRVFLSHYWPPCWPRYFTNIIFNPANSTSTHPMNTPFRTRPNNPRALTAIVIPSSTLPSVPTSFTEAQKDPKWLQAVIDEYYAVIWNVTWTLHPLRTHKVIGCKWFFWLKQKAAWSVDRYKTCSVVEGFYQLFGSIVTLPICFEANNN